MEHFNLNSKIKVVGTTRQQIQEQNIIRSSIVPSLSTILLKQETEYLEQSHTNG